MPATEVAQINLEGDQISHNSKEVMNLGDRNMIKLDPVGSTVRYEMMKLCTGSV